MEIYPLLAMFLFNFFKLIKLIQETEPQREVSFEDSLKFKREKFTFQV